MVVENLGFLVSTYGFMRLSKFGETIKSQACETLLALRAAFVNWRNIGNGLYLNQLCDGIKASRVILDSQRGSVHRGALAVTPDLGIS